ncbi:MAG: hypothetical protein IKM94_01530, partial [Alphaproteobacteria bacterium]|nr:hypothetical protein [Alphaproteobacteria bacterium]
TGYSNINAAENTYDLRFAVVSFSASFGFYGAPTTSQDNRTCMLWSNTNGTLQVSSGTTTSSSSEYRGNYTLGVPQTKVINCNNITRRYSVDGTGNYAFNGSSLNENTIQFGLSTQNGNVRYYYFKIYDNNTLVRDFIPARRERDGVIGMYDLADNNPATAFHTNAGTGTFVEGPEI